MKSTVVVMALVMLSTSVFANRGRVEPGKEAPKDHAAEQAKQQRDRDAIANAGKSQATQITEGAKVVQNMLLAGKEVGNWKDAEGNADVASQNNFMSFTNALKEAPAEQRADVAVQLMAERQGIKLEDLKPEEREAKRAEILKELMTCK